MAAILILDKKLKDAFSVLDQFTDIIGLIDKDGLKFQAVNTHTTEIMCILYIDKSAFETYSINTQVKFIISSTDEELNVVYKTESDFFTKVSESKGKTILELDEFLDGVYIKIQNNKFEEKYTFVDQFTSIRFLNLKVKKFASHLTITTPALYSLLEKIDDGDENLTMKNTKNHFSVFYDMELNVLTYSKYSSQILNWKIDKQQVAQFQSKFMNMAKKFILKFPIVRLDLQTNYPIRLLFPLESHCYLICAISPKF